MFHGTSWLHTSVRSLRFLHHLGPTALGGVNRVETCTSVYLYHGCKRRPIRSLHTSLSRCIRPLRINCLFELTRPTAKFKQVLLWFTIETYADLDI